MKQKTNGTARYECLEAPYGGYVIYTEGIEVAAIATNGLVKNQRAMGTLVARLLNEHAKGGDGDGESNSTSP